MLARVPGVFAGSLRGPERTSGPRCPDRPADVPGDAPLGRRAHYNVRLLRLCLWPP